MVVELYEPAAPKTLRNLVDLVKGPIQDRESARGDGYYDGLTFDYANPHVELRVQAHGSEDLIVFENEISASALGLHKQKIDNPGQAMDIMQRELLPAYLNGPEAGWDPSKLGPWIEQWYDRYDAEFLVGSSRQEINEALGHGYREGLASQPVSRGAVALKPHLPGRSTVRLSIILTDIPERNGQWMVIGRIVEGLDRAEAISIRALAPGPDGFRFFKPLNPVVIDSLHFECR